MGDFGGDWSPGAQRGFAWAIVDHAADFGLGGLTC